MLSTASLMVGAPAARDAVKRARNLPGLGVGLHLVLTDGTSVLPPAEIPDLVDRNGRFDDNMARAGARFFFLRRVRRQLAAEIRAQFEAFAATGLELDHVNAHKHFHIHPTIIGLVVEIGRAYGLRAVRVPCERRPGSGPMSPLRMGESLLVRSWSARLKKRLAAAQIGCNDQVFGLSRTGHMDEQAILEALRALPPGITEIYLHPATRTGVTPRMADYDHPGELAALLSPAVRDFMAAHGVQRIGFSDLGYP